MKNSKDLSPQEFFDSLNFSQLPEAEVKYIKEELLNTDQLKKLKKDSPEYTMIVNLIHESFPGALVQLAKKEPIEVATKQENVVVLPSDKSVLMARLEGLKELYVKNSKDKTINTRIKLVEEMIETK